MRIAPIDIAHKNFSKKFMGFDTEEVIEFLREMADQMEDLIRERNSLKETLREKELHILEYRERDETLKTTITTATRMAEQIRVDAEREGKLIMHDANQKAEMIVKDARDSLKRIYQEIGEIKRARIQFEANVRSIAQAHLAMLDQSQQYMPDFQNQNMNWGMSQPMSAQEPQRNNQQEQQRYNPQETPRYAPQNPATQQQATHPTAHSAQPQQQTTATAQKAAPQNPYNFGTQTKPNLGVATNAAVGGAPAPQAAKPAPTRSNTL